ncbi:MAG: TonB family protein [Oligoflexia bacterium]|nr:TonB family protein [Oligoflexia bacterium]MBF0365375.1 TonB family protein [Oligoflexia bacterium]
MLKYLFQSLLLHALLIAFCYAISWGWWLWQEERTLSNLKMLESSLRVDVVSLPKETLLELKAMTKAPAPKAVEEEKKLAEAPKEAEKDDNKEREKSEKELDKYFFEQNQKKLAEEEKKKRASLDKKTQSGLDDLKKLIIEGNKLSKGSNLDKGATTDSQEETLLLTYSAGLAEKVRSYWKLPSHLLNQSLKCRIQIFISREGELLNLRILEGSVASEFNQKAEETIRQAAPFAPPPPEIRDLARQGSIVLGFPM